MSATGLNLDQDTWRFQGGAAYGDLRYDFFGVGNTAGDLGFSVPLRQKVAGVAVEALRETWSDVYFGLRYVFVRSETRPDAGELAPGLPFPAQRDLDANVSAIGLRLQRDTRDSQFYPTTGSFLDVAANFDEKALGSDFNFQSYTAEYNLYLGFDWRHVFALRGFAKFTAGDVPFFALSTFGVHSDLRGYTAGQYRDSDMFAVQAEYRLRVLERLGFVAFAGVGEVAPPIDNFNSEDLLPSIGAGIRFMLAPKNKINLRVDFAFGKDDFVIYVGVGEAF